MATIRSEVNKYEEQLEDFRQYKRFLDEVTPQEWFLQQQEKREKAKRVWNIGALYLQRIS